MSAVMPSHLPDSALDPAPEGWDDHERVNAAQLEAHMRAEYAAFISQSVDSPEMSYRSWLEWERA